MLPFILILIFVQTLLQFVCILKPWNSCLFWVLWCKAGMESSATKSFQSEKKQSDYQTEICWFTLNIIRHEMHDCSYVSNECSYRSLLWSVLGVIILKHAESGREKFRNQQKYAKLSDIYFFVKIVFWRGLTHAADLFQCISVIKY